MPQSDRKRPGRPRRAASAGERIGLSFRVTPELKRLIDEAVDASGRSQSQEIGLKMTPLAHKIVKELTLPRNKRSFDDRAKASSGTGVLDLIRGVHCFEVTDVMGLATSMFCNHHDGELVDGTPTLSSSFMSKIIDRTGFLPAPSTWIEFEEKLGERVGFLLLEGHKPLPPEGAHPGVEKYALVMQAISGRGHFESSEVTYILPLDGVHCGAMVDKRFLKSERGIEIARYCEESSTMLIAFLALINTPKIIGRQQHMPHAGLQKRLISMQKSIGKFPLHAWTEIKLQVTPPIVEDQIYEAHLTGSKALHFCRSHLRIRYGKLEFVRSHWRGDAALGIKRSRYKVVA